MEKQERRFGSGLLRGVGILMIVFGVIETLLFVALVAVLLFVKSEVLDLFSGKRELVSAAAFLGAGLTELIAGSFGCRLAKRGKGKLLCLILGLLCLGLTEVSLILLGPQMALLSLSTLLLCSVVPVVYLCCVIAHRAPAPSPAAAAEE